VNAMLDAEADRLYSTRPYKRRRAHQDARGGSYERTPPTKAGDVSPKVLKLRWQAFKAAIIERCRSRQSSVEEALIETSLAGCRS